MTDLRSALTEHVESVTPPSGPRFSGVQRRVLRRRRQRVLGATLAVLGIAGGAGLVLQPGGTTAVKPVRPPQVYLADGLPEPSLTVLGQGLALAGAVPIAAVYVDKGRPDVIGVRYRQLARPGPCHPWLVPRLVSQDASSVIVGLYSYHDFPPEKVICFLEGSGRPEVETSLQLGTALAGRTVVDVSPSGPAIAVIDRTAYLTTATPPGHLPRIYAGAHVPGTRGSVFSQSWQQKGGSGNISLLEGEPRAVVREHVQHVGHAEVRGHPGELIRTAGGTANRCLRWQEGQDDALELCSSGYTQDVLTVAELIAFAEGLHRG